MRSETSREKLEAFCTALGNRVRSSGRIFLTGGATAVLHGWREMTIDVDLKGDPEPSGFFEAISTLKDELDINVELASPDQFIPTVPGWNERSLFIGKFGPLEVFHYDPYSQALAKLERRHPRDLHDVEAMMARGLIEPVLLASLFDQISPELLRFPAIDPLAFKQAVSDLCSSRP